MTTEKDQTYNGWTNYATWRINLEIFDDIGDRLSDDRTKFKNIGELREYLENELEEVLTGCGENDGPKKEWNTPENLCLSYARAFCHGVNFHEIAEKLIEAAPELLREGAESDEN